MKKLLFTILAALSALMAYAQTDIKVEVHRVVVGGGQFNVTIIIEGENKVTLPSYGSHYFDYIAAEDGTVTVTVSGENWKYTFAHFDAAGTKLSSKDYYAKNGDVDTVELELKSGESIVVTVGTSKGYSQPGGDITVDFHFEGDEPFVPENPLVLGKNDLTSGVAYGYVVPADGRMEFAVNAVKNSAGSKLYSWTNGKNVQILVDGVVPADLDPAWFGPLRPNSDWFL